LVENPTVAGEARLGDVALDARVSLELVRAAVLVWVLKVVRVQTNVFGERT
jgi:hypothetical protein